MTEDQPSTETVPEIHERHLERARAIHRAYCEAVTVSTTEALAVAFQAAADLLHEEADAAAEARKRGHQSLTKDLRNTAGRIVGIAQDLMELGRLEEPKPRPRPVSPAPTGITDAPDFDLSPLPDDPTPEPLPDRPILNAVDIEEVAAYLRGDVDELPKEVLVQPNPFMDPEPIATQAKRVKSAELYTYADLMQPVPAERNPDHWSWSQLTTSEGCGLQYRAQRLDGVSQVPSWANVGGSTFHAVTEAFDRGAYVQGGADLLPEVHTELITMRWQAAFESEINRVAGETGIEPGPQYDQWRASNGGREGYTWWMVEGPIMLAGYILTRRKLDKAAREAGTLAVPLELPTPVLPDAIHASYIMRPVIEYEYERQVVGPLGSLKVTGVIDRAYVLGDGTIVIKDLKSGRRVDGDDTGQLGEYAWAIVDALASQPTPDEIKIVGCFYDARKQIFTTAVDLLAKHPAEEYSYRYHTAEAKRLLGLWSPHRSNFCAACSVAHACPVVS